MGNIGKLLYTECYAGIQPNLLMWILGIRMHDPHIYGPKWYCIQTGLEKQAICDWSQGVHHTQVPL